MASAQNIVNSAYKLLGAPYRVWWYPGASIPMWLDDGYGWADNLPPVSYFFENGIECSELINYALVDNNLSPIYGTEAAIDYLVYQDYFNPWTSGQMGAVAYRPYTAPEPGYQGHIALYVDNYYLIQVLGSGVTDQYTDNETWGWGGDTAFTIYAFLDGVEY